jgi:flagellar hook-length control protein FliK
MNISLAAHSAAGATGAHAKSAKGGDPLADFMAMLDQLGIAIGEDGTLAATPQAALGTRDIATKLLAKLGKKDGDAQQPGKSGDPLLDSDAEGDGKTKDDSVTTLADLLAQIDPAATKSAEPVKLDIATLISAVRALAAGQAKPATTETAVTSDQTETKAAPVTAATAPSIAALLARPTRGARDDSGKPVAPGAVQSAFARLGALISEKPTSTSTTTAPTNDGTEDATAPAPLVADQTASAEEPKVDNKGEKLSDKPATPAKLTELLARLTASVKQGTAQPQAQATTPTPPAPSQVAALAQAIQQASKDDKPVQNTPDSATTGTTFGIAPATTPAAPAAAAPGTDMVQTNPAEELAKHHLDLARDTQWLDTLARDIARAAQSDNLLRFQLNPEHLGSLKVELLNGAHGTSVKLTADTEAARAILADAQPRLIAEARAQGLRISEAQVDLGGHGGGQRHMAETPVVIRTAGGSTLAEVEQDRPAASGERYA